MFIICYLESAYDAPSHSVSNFCHMDVDCKVTSFNSLLLFILLATTEICPYLYQVDQVTTDLHSIEGDYMKIMELWESFRETAKEAANHIPVDDRPPMVTCAGHLDPPCTNTISAFIEETTRVMNDFMDDKKNAQHEVRNWNFEGASDLTSASNVKVKEGGDA